MTTANASLRARRLALWLLLPAAPLGCGPGGSGGIGGNGSDPATPPPSTGAVTFGTAAAVGTIGGSTGTGTSGITFAATSSTGGDGTTGGVGTTGGGQVRAPLPTSWTDGGVIFSPACTGPVHVDAGWLAGGVSSDAIGAVTFTPYGERLILAPSAGIGCDMEQLGTPEVEFAGTWAEIEITLSPTIALGSYVLGQGGAPEIQVRAAWSGSFGYTNAVLQTGTLDLTEISPADGIAGSYSLDFGESPFGGAVATTSGGGTTTVGPLGHLLEVGSFAVPVCELCPVAPTCVDGGYCAANQICVRGGPGGCIDALSCSGAPSCGGCSPDACGGQLCAGFDGLSEFCEITF